MTAPRRITVHGHFYQPPRENPWLERIEVQDSAAPFHDWNARVAAECYGPNSAARRVGADGGIVDIVNNFSRISFDVGPTLMAWLRAERPDVYAAILAADRESRAARGGHGNALAQAYNHAILPLASRRDKRTQVRWGLADFRHHFGREAEGMWLPETAVDRETLETLAEAGVAFTLLAPHQAAQVREEAGADWQPAGAAIDPSRPYRCDLGAGRALTLFFFDGPISHAVAFEGLLGSGDALAARLLDGFDDRRPGAQLVHVATDGESYGHHHRFGEMALAAACARIEADGPARLTNYAAFLAELAAPGMAATPMMDVQVVEGSSWSCVHGVERWRADCGCRTGHPDWHQRWRAPLREALDWLRDAVDALFEARAGALLKDPWEARDGYVAVLLDRSPASARAFLARHALRPLEVAERVQALELLELERHRLLMYTSCGWFFDDLAGLEAVQVLRHAARAIQLARDLGADAGLEEGFIRRLAAAPSNVPELATGDQVYRRRVLPDVTDLPRVAAHYAVTANYEDHAASARVYAFRVDRLAWRRESAGETSLAVGLVRATAELTTRSQEIGVAVLHRGGPDVHAVVAPGLAARSLEAAGDDLFERFASRDLDAVVRAMDRHFGRRAYGIRDAFLEERRRLIGRLAEVPRRRFEDACRRFHEEGRTLVPCLREAGLPVPEALALAARLALGRQAEGALAELAAGGAIGPGVARLQALRAEAELLGVALPLDERRTARDLEQALLATIGRLEAAVAPEAVAEALAVLDLARALGSAPDLWLAQNRVFRLGRAAAPADRRRLGPLAAGLGLRLEAA